MKLILTTSFVVSGAVFASAWFSRDAVGDLTRDLAEADTKSRRDDGLAAIQREAQILCKNTATAISVPLTQNQLSEIEPLLTKAKTEFDQIQWLAVIDQQNLVVAVTPGAPGLTKNQAFTDSMTDTLAQAAPGTLASSNQDTDYVYGVAIESGGVVVGQLRMGMSTKALEDKLTASIREAEGRAGDAKTGMRDKLTLVSLCLLAVGIGLAALQGLRMAAPLRLLALQAERIAGGHFEQRVPEERGDEIGLLARNFNFMASSIGELLHEKAHAASLEREMSLARQVQQSMLPPPGLVAHGGMRVLGHCVPASSCGGDWWTFRKLSGARLLVVIGDATGHGLHSALIAATARGAVEALADADERLLTPEQVLRAIHAAISGIGDHSLLMTCFAAVLDPNAGTLWFANAGQNFPYVLRRGSTGALDDAQIIAASGNPLGDPSVQQTLRRGSVPLRSGDVLVTFTDGVVERSNPTGKLFGDRRLRAVFRGQKVDSEDELVALRERVVTAIDTFADGTTAQDDVTFVLVQCESTAGRMRTAS